MMNQESKRPVTVEDLLRFKRAERPQPAFWEEFDRELRAKQLAALVEKRPWWNRIPKALRGMARYQIPLGATAVLAVTLLSIREYRPSVPARNLALAGMDVERAENVGVTGQTKVVPEAAVSTESVVPQSAPVTVSAPVALSSDATAPGELARMVPMLPAEDVASHRPELPSARSIAENRAVAEAMLGTTAASGFETRALPPRTPPQEPLAQMSNPAEARRSRFAVAFASAAIGNSPAQTARVARRLSDEQLYDSIHRFGASGNSVSFKF